MMAREQPRQGAGEAPLLPSARSNEQQRQVVGSRNDGGGGEFAPRSVETSSFERDGAADPISLNTRVDKVSYERAI